MYSIPSVFGTSKEQQKNIQICIDFSFIFDAKITQKSIQKRCELQYPSRTHMFPDFYRILAPSWTPKPTQDPRKNRKKAKIIDQKSHQKFDEKTKRPANPPNLSRRGVSPYKLSRSGR